MRLRAPSNGAVAAALVLAAGCGGPLEREELVARANAICVRAESEAAAISPPPRGGGPAATARYVNALIPIAEREWADLRGLEPPPALRVRYERFLASGDRGLALLGDLRAAARERRAGRARALLARLETLTNDAEEQAKGLGLAECAE